MHRFVLLAAFCLLALPDVVQCCSTTKKPRLHPVVFVPGLGGSIIEAKTTPLYDNRGCEPKPYWHRLWITLSDLLTNQRCVTDNLELRPNPRTGGSRNARGVDTRIPYWGSMKSANFVDRSLLVRLTADCDGNKGVYALFLTRLLTDLGYKENKDLVAAPYDFRYAPRSQSQYFAKLKLLVERTYEKNENQRVVLIAHSLGGLMTNHFLVEMSPDWKQKYVERFVPVAVPWAGSVKALYLFTTGRVGNNSLVKPSEQRRMMRTWETSVITLPSGRAWNRTELLTTDSGLAYTVDDMRAYFSAIGEPAAYAGYAHFRDGDGLTPHPGVDVSLVFSSGVPTVERVEFTPGVEFPDGAAAVRYGDGDGSVNARSLLAARHWGRVSGHEYREYEEMDADHLDVLSGDVVHKLMADINGN